MSNLTFVIAFVTNGDTQSLSAEFLEEVKTIQDEYGNGTFSRFDLRVWGCTELVDELNAAEKKNKNIDADIRIRYDANTPSLIKFLFQGLKGAVCSASAKEVARIVNQDKSGYVFDSNIRRFLGSRGAVNADIRATCTSQQDARLFWFLNNGITIVCDSFDPVTDPDNPIVKVKNLQIVNGCQTATTLARAEREGQLSSDVWVLLRIYEAPAELVDKIVLTTNNQNKISTRDLRANDRVQIDMEQRFAKYGLLYERKVRQFDCMEGVEAVRIVSNEIVAQSYLAVVLRKPSDARRRKYRIWHDLYDKIFAGQAIEPYVMAYLLHERVKKWVKKSGYTESKKELLRRVAKNGVFHIARIAAFMWCKGDDWAGKGKESKCEKRIAELLDGNASLDVIFEASIQSFMRVIESNEAYASDLDGAMKSNILDADIDRYLYRNKDAVDPSRFKKG